MPEPENAAPKPKPKSEPGKFGTFGGVFTPSTLTILGVIMFLRFGQVVGQSGIYNALIIVLCAKLITTLTALSISAIATNTRVKGGGAYFLISRSLGVEFGGAIGVVFFLAQAISVAMYVIGFTEAFLNTFPTLNVDPQVVSSTINLVVFICVYIGAGWTIKVQYGILAVLVLALGSFFAGAFPAATSENLNANWSAGYLPGNNFFTMFALFFPAVTGIMAGVNMSGDLASPSKSIPRGTLLAILFTAIVYLGMAVLLGAARPRSALTDDPFTVFDIAASSSLIVAGVFAATLSSALGSMMGAPRILQALARDHIFPSIRSFGRGSGASNEPRHATVLTFFIAEACILLGDLNAIAPIITMFFMVTYGTINLACFYESITGNPSYRPAFRFSHWASALLGAVGCGAVMILISPLWAFGSIGAMGGLHWIISRKEIRARWGDVGSGAAFERARRSLLKLEEEKYHPKNWRPIILALSGGAFLRNHIAEFGYWLTSGHGVLTLAQVITGDVENRIEARENAESKLRKFIATEDLEAFPAVVVESDLLGGAKSLLQCHGLGGFKPNTVILGWSENPEAQAAYGRLLRLVKGLGRSLVIVRCDREERIRWSPPTGTVDIWWRGGGNSTMMLMLAHLLVQNPDWRRHTVRILHAVAPDADEQKARDPLLKMLEAARIKAVVEIVPGKDTLDSLRIQSRNAAVVMIGYDPPEDENDPLFSPELTACVNDFHQVLLVSSAGGMSLVA
jgi:amino acid transporter